MTANDAIDRSIVTYIVCWGSCGIAKRWSAQNSLHRWGRCIVALLRSAWKLWSSCRILAKRILISPPSSVWHPIGRSLGGALHADDPTSRGALASWAPVAPWAALCHRSSVERRPTTQYNVRLLLSRSTLIIVRQIAIETSDCVCRRHFIDIEHAPFTSTTVRSSLPSSPSCIELGRWLSPCVWHSLPQVSDTHCRSVRWEIAATVRRFSAGDRRRRRLQTKLYSVSVHVLVDCQHSYVLSSTNETFYYALKKGPRNFLANVPLWVEWNLPSI